MKKALVFLLSCLFLVPAFSQEDSFKEAFLDGDYFMMYEEYADALPYYLQLYEQQPDNANICYRIGVCYINLPGQKEKAIPFLEKAIRNTSPDYRQRNHRETRAPMDAYYYLGTAYRIQNELGKAKQTFERYLGLIEKGDTINRNFVQQQIDACNRATDFMKHPVYFDAQNVGAPVNDAYSNYNPLTTPDETAMVYVTALKFYDAIFFVEKINGQWTDPVNLSPQILSDGDLYPTCLSADGDKLLLSKDEDFNSDIYISRRENGMWTPAVRLGKNINTKYWENHACVSPDGKTMIFTSNKPGGYGGFDLYMSRYDETLGEWGEAVNLGPVINTEFNEETPFLTSGGKQIYFSSQGHETMGGYDVFTSSQDENGNWTKPVNIGYPINTTDDDMFFFPLHDGIEAYFARYTKDGFGQEDIYRYDIYSDKNPRLVSIQGKITLEDKTGASGVMLQLSGPSTAGKKISVPLDPETGAFTYQTKVPGTYTLTGTADGYHPFEKQARVPDDYSLAKVSVQGTLEPVPVSIITLPTLYFEFDKFRPGPGSEEKLDHLAEIMKGNPGLTIEIIGHTDAKGGERYNLRLSERRALAVRDMLVEKGIPAVRIQTTGRGESEPLAMNQYSDGRDCPEGRKLNRRVYIRITGSDNPAIREDTPEVPDNLKIK